MRGEAISGSPETRTSCIDRYRDRRGAKRTEAVATHASLARHPAPLAAPVAAPRASPGLGLGDSTDRTIIGHCGMRDTTHFSLFVFENPHGRERTEHTKVFSFI